MRRSIALALALCASCAPPEPEKRPAPAPADDAGRPPAEGAELIGTAAPEFAGLSDWTNSAPLTLASLKGKAVLVRFWTTGCSLCRHTAPALVEIERKYGDRGLVVVGVHHPKDPEARAAAVWRATAAEYGFNFPLAQDQEWKTVDSWWLERGTQRRFTSATFLVDRHGVIRWLHPGGEFFDGPGEPGEAYRACVAAVERVLAGDGAK